MQAFSISMVFTHLNDPSFSDCLLYYACSYSKFKNFYLETEESYTILVLYLYFFIYFFFSGPKTGPDPTPPKPKTTTSSPIGPTKPTPSEKTTTVSTTTDVVPSQDACQIKEFDTITEIQKELYFFKNGYELLFYMNLQT